VDFETIRELHGLVLGAILALAVWGMVLSALHPPLHGINPKLVFLGYVVVILLIAPVAATRFLMLVAPGFEEGVLILFVGHLISMVYLFILTTITTRRVYRENY
jgi:hypothetical protein